MDIVWLTMIKEFSIMGVCCERYFTLWYYNYIYLCVAYLTMIGRKGFEARYAQMRTGPCGLSNVAIYLITYNSLTGRGVCMFLHIAVAKNTFVLVANLYYICDYVFGYHV